MASHRFHLLALLLLVVLLTPLRAGAQEALVLPRLSGEIHLDGRVDEAAWSHVEPLPTVVFAPRYGEEPTQRTEIRLAHDGTFLYASARFYDTDPSAIRADALVRDDDGEDDFFNLVIDTFHDGENALWFLVTPLGDRVDGAITANAEGSGWNHFEYDSFWDARASMDSTGWFAEMRIPLASLRFHRNPDGSVTMGVIAGRFISRSGERHVFPDIEPGPPVAHYKPSLAAPVVLRDVEEETPLYVRPYALAGAERVALGAPGAPGRDDTLLREVGGDAKVGLASNLTLDLTVNTDFAQTEIDDARSNLTRYDLLLPEKRAFFLERSGTFTLDAGEGVRLFHSRRIGLDGDGSPLRVLGGTRLVGRAGSWDVGFLDLLTDAPTGTGTDNAGVLRLRRNVAGTDSYVGGIVTSSTQGDAGWTVGLDGVLNVTGDHYVAFETGVTPSGGPGHDNRIGSRSALGRLLVERRNTRGWTYRGEAAWLGSAFQPALGFVQRNGITLGNGEVGYGRFGGRTFQASGVSLRGSVARRHEDGGVESGQVGVSWFGNRRGGGRVRAEFTWRHEGLLTPFHLDDATVPAGGHGFLEGSLLLETPKGRSAWSGITVSGGSFYDGHRVTASVTPTWTVSRHLRLSGTLEGNHIWFPSRSQEYTGYVAQLRARLSPDTHLSLMALLQRDGAAGTTTANVRLRYMIREGHDVYLVFTSGEVDPGRAEPGVVRARRSVVLKYATTVH